MKRLKFWIAFVVVIIVVACLVIWTQNLSPKPWITILIWTIVIIILQLMFIDLIVKQNRHK